jgi:hypothetical protein
MRSDLRAGVLAAVTANFSMGKDPDRPPLQPSDFFPSLAQQAEPEEMSIEAMYEIIKLAGQTGKRH